MERVGAKDSAAAPTERQDEAGARRRRLEESGCESTELALGTIPVTDQPEAELPEVDPSQYHIEREVARGGMGQILLARDQRTGRRVALKQITDHLLDGGSERDRVEYRVRFEREARITAQLEHPAIVPVYEIGKLGDAPFFAMKMVRGEPLDRLMDRATSVDERIALLDKVIAVADAIAYAHERGVIHRDLKPANILCGRHGETVVIDWGLAKALDDGPDDEEISLSGQSLAPGLTEAGVVFGTPQYMSPEQGRGEPLDSRADVYAIGTILYRLLGGRAPYTPREHSDNPSADVVAQLIGGPPPPIGEVEPKVPRDLQSIVARAIAHDRAERYPDATELAADLRRFQAQQLVAVHDYSPLERLRRWIGAHRLLSATLVSAVVIAIILFELWEAEQEKIAALVQQPERSSSEITALLDSATETLQAAERHRLQLLERGRLALHEGQLSRAAILLAHAYRARSDDPTTQLLLGQATEPLKKLTLSTTLNEYRRGRVLDDGSLATVSKSTVRIWPPGSPTPHTVELGDDHSQIDVSANGRYAVRRTDAHLEFWDITRERNIRKWRTKALPLPAPNLDPDISNDGRWVTDRVVRSGLPYLVTWDTQTGTEVRAMQLHLTDPVASAYVIDDRTLLSHHHGEIEYFDLIERKVLSRVRLPHRRDHRLIVSPTSTLVGVIDQGSHHSWVIDRNGIVAEFDDPDLVEVIPRDQQQVLTLRQHGGLMLWRIAPDGEKHLLADTVPKGAVRWAILRHDGRQLAVAADNRSVALYDLGTPDAPELRQQALLPSPGDIVAIGYAQNSTDLTIATSRMRFHYRTDGDFLGATFESRVTGSQALSPDGRLWLTAKPKLATMWSTEDAAVLHEIPDAGANSAAFSPDGELFYLGNGIWDVATRTRIAEYEGIPVAQQMVVLAETGKLAVARPEGGGAIVDGKTGKQLALLELPSTTPWSSSVIFAAVAGNSRAARIAGACHVGTCVWNDRGALIQSIPKLFSIPMALIGSQHLAMYSRRSGRRGVDVYSLATGERTGVASGVALAARYLDFYEETPRAIATDGRRRIVSMASDATLRGIWQSRAHFETWPRAQQARPGLLAIQRRRSVQLVAVEHGAVLERNLPSRHSQVYHAHVDRGRNILLTRGARHAWIWPLPREERDPALVLNHLTESLQVHLSPEGFVVPLESNDGAHAE